MTFYPGPSQLYPQIAEYLRDAYESGLLSANHRSPVFMELVRETDALLREKLAIPADYSVYFVSSATECWEIIAQSLTGRGSVHFFNGAFGQKWAEYAGKLHEKTEAVAFDLDESLTHRDDFDFLAYDQYDVVCLTQNETSNGTQIRDLSGFQNLTGLKCIDATSSMAGVDFDWSLGDVWFASVQKCFGLPAGLALLVCSPKALRHAEMLGERDHYNSLLFIDDNARKFQTHYTPNGLGIYLLNRVMQQVPPIAEVATRLRQRAAEWYRFLEKETSWQPLVKNPAVRSDTVIAIEGNPEEIKAVKQRCAEVGSTLGNGYGVWKDTTFRIANFPAIESEAIEKLKKIRISPLLP
ncbi:MAG: aminotransferase class V-fold PLP-dependent enzyme [Sphingobacteriaceae bacterium]|nr:aminotransferase class V-fold PLP-dependent enzyme [Cytophagaceae bacterium]